MPRQRYLTFEQINNLIDQVRNHPCIWNTENDGYYDRGTMARAWTEIATQTDLPEDIIRLKWKNLRDLFVREVKKKLVTDNYEYRGKWKHFRKLWFLYKAVTGEQNDSDGEMAEISPGPYDIVKVEPADDLQYTLVSSEPDEPPDSRKRKSPVEGDNLEEQEEGNKRKRSDVYTDEECDMMFLKSLAPFFKALKPIRKLVMRNKIQEMLLNEHVMVS